MQTKPRESCAGETLRRLRLALSLKVARRRCGENSVPLDSSRVCAGAADLHLGAMRMRAPLATQPRENASAPQTLRANQTVCAAAALPASRASPDSPNRWPPFVCSPKSIGRPAPRPICTPFSRPPAPPPLPLQAHRRRAPSLRPERVSGDGRAKRVCAAAASSWRRRRRAKTKDHYQRAQQLLLLQASTCQRGRLRTQPSSCT